MQNSFSSQNVIDLPANFILNSNFVVGKSAWGQEESLQDPEKAFGRPINKTSIISDVHRSAQILHGVETAQQNQPRSFCLGCFQRPST